MAKYEVIATNEPDNLIAGHEIELLTAAVTIAAGQSLKRGSVLGIVKIEFAVPTVASDTENNTGNGTITGVELGAGAKVGEYTLVCTETTVGGGTFGVTDPDGDELTDAEVGTDYSSTQISFKISAGDTDFVEGDTFTITVALKDNAGKAKLCNASSVDGSEIAKYVLPLDVDTTEEEETVAVWKTGIFNKNALIFGSGDTAAAHEEELRDVNIHMRDSLYYKESE